MYREIRLENFRGFHDLHVSDLARVTLISGRNNTGKSALLEGVFLHSTGAFAAQIAIRLVKGIRGEPVIAQTDPSGPSIWDSLFYNRDESNAIRFSANIDGDDYIIELRKPAVGYGASNISPASSGGTGGTGFAQSIEVSVTKNQGPVDSYIQTATTSTIGSGLVSGTNLVETVNLQLDLQPPKGSLLLPASYQSAKTRAQQREIANRYSKLKRSTRDKEFFEALKTVEPRLTGLEILISDGQPVLHAQLGNDKLLPLPLLGDGMSAVADIMGSLFEVRGGIILIDEFENGLHYSILPTIWKHIHRAAERTNVQVIATTHSRECVEAAYQALRGRPNELRLLRLQASHHDSSQVTVETYDPEMIESALDMNLDVR